MSLTGEGTMPPEEIGHLIAEQFAEGVPYVHLRDVPFTRLEAAEQTMYIRRASEMIGELSLSSGDPTSDVWRLDTVTSPSASRIPYHTDNPFYKLPERFIGFWNLKSSMEGGENVLLTVDNLLEQLGCLPDGNELIDELETHQVTFAHDLSEAVHPILDTRQEVIRYDRRYADAQSVQLADRFTQILESGRLRGHVIKLAEGDVLFFDNYRLLHARESYTDLGRVSLRVRIEASENANDR